jgi:hypothetical protein
MSKADDNKSKGKGDALKAARAKLAAGKKAKPEVAKIEDDPTAAPEAPKAEPTIEINVESAVERDPRWPAAGTKVGHDFRGVISTAEAKIVANGIEFDGEVYATPTTAAKAAMKAHGMTVQPVNGWAFWGLTGKARKVKAKVGSDGDVEVEIEGSESSGSKAPSAPKADPKKIALVLDAIAEGGSAKVSEIHGRIEARLGEKLKAKGIAEAIRVATSVGFAARVDGKPDCLELTGQGVVARAVAAAAFAAA